LQLKKKFRGYWIAWMGSAKKAMVIGLTERVLQKKPVILVNEMKMHVFQKKKSVRNTRGCKVMENSAYKEWFYSLAEAEDKEIINNVSIDSVNVYKKTGKLEVVISADKLVPAAFICRLEDTLSKKLGISTVVVKPRFNINTPLDNVLSEYWEDILYLVGRKIALTNSILTKSTYELSGSRLTVNLKTVGSDIARSQKCDSVIQEIIYNLFNQEVKVEFVDAAIDEEAKKEYFENKENEEMELINNIIDFKSIKSGKKSSRNRHNDAEDNFKRIIIGKKFNDKPVPMNSINEASGKVTVAGDVFKVETREIRGGKTLFTFNVTDYTNSLTAKLFLEKEKLARVQEAIREGTSVSIRGEVQYDKYARDIVLLAYDIIEVEKEVKKDNAETKRVELHLHTQMSAMDGVSPVKDIVKRAISWGHKAVAITDHGVLQAYPDAFAAAGKNIKIIYGVECYLVDSQIPIVFRSKGQSLDGDFVVFDIETTGLDPFTDKITEIGAVRISNGQILEEFSTFVNPEISIPENIAKLTGIDDNLVANAPRIEEVLPEFLKFVGDSPLVAHNATFDYGFIMQNLRKLDMKAEYTLIDTLELSRKLFPDLSKYKLSSVAKHLQLESDRYHRASDDAGILARIFIKCIELLKKREVKNLDDIEKCFGTDDQDVLRAEPFHAILLAKNRTGLKNLYRIVSDSHIKYFYKKPRVPKKLLAEFRNGIIVGSACEAGEIFRAILENKNETEIEKLVRFYDYLEIQPLGNNRFLINNGTVRGEEDLININKKIIELGGKFNKPVVATCDVHFLDEKDEVFRRIIMAGQGYADADYQAPLYFRTTEEMLREFEYLGQEKAYEVVVENTNKIAGMISDITPVPKGTFPPKMEGAEEQIKNMAESKAKEVYGDPLPNIVRERLDKELNSIIKNGFAVMYLIAQKLVAKSMKDGYLVGSRGSVGSSFVANMVGITEVNSLQPHYLCTNCRHSEFITDGSVECGFDLPDKNCPKCGNPMSKNGMDIPFETFLGFEGDKEPDIDLNFSGDYQPVVHKYTEELFGVGHVFRAGTITTIASKTAFGFVKGYLDERGLVVTNAEIERLVNGCTGIKRTTGQHPGGVMVIPQDMEVYDFSPVQRPADDVSSDVITTHFDYNFLHGSILKLDILGHTVPTIIRMLEDLTGVDAKSIPFDDQKTMSLFSSTEALGIKPEDIGYEVGTLAIPEFGTGFVIGMLLETKPSMFSELVRISGLSHGTDVWLNNAQELIAQNITTLSKTICCRDDIMLYLIYQGLEPKTAFFIMEDVRKGKGVKPEYEEKMKANNVPDWYIESCKKIKYMFPKAHAAAYVMMAYRIAWFKVYYPIEFYTTYFTICANDFNAALMVNGPERVKAEIKKLKSKVGEPTQKEKDLLTILEVVNEMYARGIKFLPVNLYKSDASKFTMCDNYILPPLIALQGLGLSAACNIVEARKAGRFTSVEDLKQKSKITKAVVDILKENGCLEGLPDSNQMSFF